MLPAEAAYSPTGHVHVSQRGRGNLTNHSTELRLGVVLKFRSLWSLPVAALLLGMLATCNGLPGDRYIPSDDTLRIGPISGVMFTLLR